MPNSNSNSDSSSDNTALIAAIYLAVVFLLAIAAAVACDKSVVEYVLLVTGCTVVACVITGLIGLASGLTTNEELDPPPFSEAAATAADTVSLRASLTAYDYVTDADRQEIEHVFAGVSTGEFVGGRKAMQTYDGSAVRVVYALTPTNLLLVSLVIDVTHLLGTVISSRPWTDALIEACVADLVGQAPAVIRRMKLKTSA